MSAPEKRQPRKINPSETFQRIVSWLKNRAVKDKMPGIIVGVSGTDSLVVFLAAYQAFKELGRPQAVTAVNFVHPGSLQTTGDSKITCTDDKDWFARMIMPWLKEAAPGAHYVLDDTITFSDDNKRWGNIFSRAISDTNLNHGMLGNYRLVAGTRNRTEAILGTYTLLSRTPSLQPIEHLYKTQILEICEQLKVPRIAIQKSREVDCDCGRFDVQANHLDALDHYIMTQQGDLDAAFLETIAPDILSAVRSFYIEERENNAFREKIPYRPTPTKTVYAGEDIQTALAAVSMRDPNIKSVSMVTPRIIIDNDADSAYEIVTTASDNRPDWMAEAFTLLGTGGLSAEQKRAMVTAVFGPGASNISDEQVAKIASLSGAIGQYSFSFPAKRFTTKGFASGPSLIERAGFTRQTRPTDVLDETLPKSNPQRDKFGTGFTWSDQSWYVEQRRAYILFSETSSKTPVTLLIRNSSHFFGRDRLKHAAYVSLGHKDPQFLLDLDESDIENVKNFTPWQNIFQNIFDDKDTLPLPEILSRVHHALEALNEIDCKFSQWLRTHKGTVRFNTAHENLKAMFNDGGYSHLRALLKETLTQHVSAEKPGSPFYLAELDPGHAAPWQPHSICNVTTDILAQLKNLQESAVTIRDDKLRRLFHPIKQRQLVLISGQYGDFPVR